MANKKLNQLVTKPSIASGDLFPIADATTGQLYKTTISDLGTAIGSGVSSVNGLVGAVVLDTDDIQELASPVNKWFTDLRARAALSAGIGISYSSSTGVIASTITQYTDALARAAVSLTTTGSNGSATYNSTTGVLNVPAYTLSGLGGQPLAGNLTALAGLSYSSLGFIKMTGVGTLALDTNTYLTTSSASSTYVPYTGANGNVNLGNYNISSNTVILANGNLTSTASGPSGFTNSLVLFSLTGYGNLFGVDGSFSTKYFGIKTDGTFIHNGGNAIFGSNLTAASIIKSGGTSAQFLKADGSVDSTSYQTTLTNPVTGTGTSGIVAKFNGTSTITDSIIYDNGTRVSIGADVTTSNKFVAVASTTSSYAIVAQASGAANGFWATLSGSGEIFRGQTSGGSYFIINNGGNAFLNGNLNVGDFASTSYKLKVNGTANFTDDVTFDGGIGAINFSTSTTITNTASSGYTAIYANGGGIYLGGSASVNHLSIASGGAATFSSSVTANQISSIVTSGTARITIGDGAVSGGSLLNLGGISGGKTWFISNNYNIGGALEFMQSTTNGGTTPSSSPSMIITSAGNVGIGTTSPSSKLHVNGGLRLQNGSSDLTYYEEGTFTPSLTFGGGSTGMSFFDRAGVYTRIGRQVTCTIYLALTAKGSSTGDASLTGLPFTNGNYNRGSSSAASIRFDNITYLGDLQLILPASTNYISFEQVTIAGLDSRLTHLNFNDSTEMTITVTYFV